MGYQVNLFNGKEYVLSHHFIHPVDWNVNTMVRAQGVNLDHEMKPGVEKSEEIRYERA